ncbi:phosphoribosyltransferase [bacterium]|nr:phosphoribosyltransferase [bacterium]
MAEFNEKQIHNEIAILVKNKELDLTKVAVDRITKYVKILDLLISNNTFDLVISGGNSGLYCTRIVELIYEIKKIEKPLIFSIPAYRHNKKYEIETKGKLFDNSSLVSYVDKKISNNLKMQKVLFVDDEIQTGTTAKNTIDLIIKAKNISSTIEYTLVAENHFFEWRHGIENIDLRYFASAKVLPGYNNLLAFIVPRDVYTKIAEILNREVMLHSYAFALLTSGLVKDRGNGKPYYDDTKEKTVIANYPKYISEKEKLNKDLKNLIERILNE